MAREDDIRRERARLEAESLDTSRQMMGVQQDVLNAMEQQNMQLEFQLGMREKGRALTAEEKKNITDTYAEHRKYVDNLGQQVRLQKQSLSIMQKIGSITSAIYAGTKNYVYDYLMTADKSIKAIALEFGQAGGRADDMRTAIEGSAIGAARLGMSVQEITENYRTYVDQVGRTVAMNEQQMEAMAALAKGTNLANGEAARLAGQFEMMGLDIIAVNKEVEGILETSERMGVNATKVLKAVASDFKRLQTYTFRTGVQGMGDMAAYAEKFKLDIDTALGSAEKSRRLAGAVELAAKLQVLGGEFAKSDPFEMLFLSRNDPEKFQKKITELTKGMATLNKVGDKFEFQLASPMARDLLEHAGVALGISTEKMTEMALQQGKINKMRQEMFNSGYTKDQMDILEGLSQMDSSTGKFFVNVKGVRRDIASLTKTELDFLDKQSVSLKERAKNAQTFDEQWKIFMLELKAVGIPLLRGINDVLGTIRGWMDGFTNVFKDVKTSTEEWQKSIGKGIGYLLLGMPVILKLLKLAKSAIFKGGGKAGVATAADTMGAGAGTARKGAGLAALGKGAGVGLAGAGIGGGIMLATKGIAELAESMKELDGTQILGLGGVMLGITVSMYAMIPAMTAMIPLIAALGAAGTAGSLGLLAIGGAAVGVGYGVKLIGEGIQLAGEGIGNVVSSITNGVGGIIDASREVKNIDFESFTKNAKGIENVSNSLSKISVALRGSKEDYGEIRDTINTIANADFSNLNALGQLKQLFSQPLKVEFSNKEVAMVSNITLEIDGEKFVNRLNIHKNAGVEINRLKNGGVS